MYDHVFGGKCPSSGCFFYHTLGFALEIGWSWAPFWNDSIRWPKAGCWTQAPEKTEWRGGFIFVLCSRYSLVYSLVWLPRVGRGTDMRRGDESSTLWWANGRGRCVRQEGEWPVRRFVLCLGGNGGGRRETRGLGWFVGKLFLWGPNNQRNKRSWSL